MRKEIQWWEFFFFYGVEQNAKQRSNVLATALRFIILSESDSGLG